MNINDILKEIAVKNGVSEEEVRREIEASIAEACKDPKNPINKLGKGRVPTTEEVMEHVLKEVAKSQMN
ncbi:MULTISPECIES: hypothetical protein [Ruminococcus]|uniref:hypothetical protein n=1 Tax=Ruminococcus TaxID=1263 RepID=UPI0005609697|nr:MULTISPECIES: hypothetical protein [Ruminococcus]HNZ99500.1 hypothetical protein [Ruminococcus sp.]HOH87918.1 hypothetical protein [Ruminococcus sp.]